MDNGPNEEVFLRIYDITSGMAKQFSESILGFQIEGVWHTSLELYGREFYFQGIVQVSVPGKTPFGTPVNRISYGHTSCTEKELAIFITDAKDSFTAESYDPLENNCNHFTDFLCNFLIGKGIPEDILDLFKKLKNTEFCAAFLNQNRN